ncbi:MAG: hypothetical protein SCK29_01870 [Bacillota bacterium]|nr:hypothetical protein [Bacillota bacterium]MDW7682849.1 hypothetical protein [Bacillota bacterium]
MRNAGLIILFLFLLAAVISGCSSQDTANEATIELQELLANIQSSGVSLETFYGEMEMTSTMEGMTEPEEFAVWFDSDGRYRLESDVADVGTFIHVFDGKTLWMYTEADHSVLRMDMDVQAAFEDNNLTLDMFTFITEPEELFDFTYEGTADFAGRETHILDVIPRDVNERLDFNMTWWIDAETWFPVSYELTVEDISFTATYKTFAINPDLPDDRFSFTPPAGAEIMDMGNLLDEYEFDFMDDYNLEDMDVSDWAELENLLRELEEQQDQ